MAQEGVVTAGEHRSEASTLSCQACMANGVDAPMDLMHAPGGMRIGDRTLRVAEFPELMRRYDPMLSLCELGDSMVSSWFGTHNGTKGELTLLRPPVGG
jgi:hypothetical protein